MMILVNLIHSEKSMIHKFMILYNKYNNFADMI